MEPIWAAQHSPTFAEDIPVIEDSDTHHEQASLPSYSAEYTSTISFTKISDLAERRRIQHRIAQRNYRKTLKKRLEDIERRAGSSSESLRNKAEYQPGWHITATTDPLQVAQHPPGPAAGILIINETDLNQEGLFEYGVWKCNCSPRKPARHLVASLQSTQRGRGYYTCFMHECRFFLWEDDAKRREAETRPVQRRIKDNQESEVHNSQAPPQGGFLDDSVETISQLPERQDSRQQPNLLPSDGMPLHGMSLNGMSAGLPNGDTIASPQEQYAPQPMSSDHMYPPSSSSQYNQSASYGPVGSQYGAMKRKQVRATQACNNCRARKQPCDEQRPCAFCKDSSYDCVYKHVPAPNKSSVAPPDPVPVSTANNTATFPSAHFDVKEDAQTRKSDVWKNRNALSSNPAKKHGLREAKVQLKEQKGPLDWVNVTNSGENLSGVPSVLRVTPKQLKHNNGTEGRPAWSSFQGKVYNITPYFPFHPGGELELGRAAGKDCEKLFMGMHPWVNLEKMLGKCFVGTMAGEDDVEISQTPKPSQVSELSEGPFAPKQFLNFSRGRSRGKRITQEDDEDASQPKLDTQGEGESIASIGSGDITSAEPTPRDQAFSYERSPPAISPMKSVGLQDEEAPNEPPRSHGLLQTKDATNTFRKIMFSQPRSPAFNILKHASLGLNLSVFKVRTAYENTYIMSEKLKDSPKELESVKRLL